MNFVLQHKLGSHVCTILVQLDSEDPIEKLTRVMTELQILENEMKKIQRNFEDSQKILKITEKELAMARETTTKYKNDFQVASSQIKELKERVKGNMYPIQAMEIMWNDIIHTVRNIWEFY